MPEYNVTFRVECTDVDQADVLEKKLKSSSPFDGTNKGYNIKRKNQYVYAAWDHDMVEEHEEDTYDIGVMIQHLFKFGSLCVFGNYMSEHDEGIGMFFCIDINSFVDDPDILESEGKYFPVYQAGNLTAFLKKNGIQLSYVHDVAEEADDYSRIADGFEYPCFDALAKGLKSGEITLESSF